MSVKAFESGRASAARSEVESRLLSEHVDGVTQEAIDEGRISAARSDAASRLTGEAIKTVEQPLIGMTLSCYILVQNIIAVDLFFRQKFR